MSPSQPGAWNAKSDLNEYAMALRKDTKAAREAQAQAIGLKAEQLLTMEKNEAHLVAQASLKPNPTHLPSQSSDPTLTAVTSKSKRKASSELAIADRKRAFQGIVRLQQRSHESYRQTLSMQRETNRTISAYHESYGSDPPSSSSPPKTKAAPSSPAYNIGG